MGNYLHAETREAMRKIKEMFAFVKESKKNIDHFKQRYSAETAEQMIEELRAQYQAANAAAKSAVLAAVKAARDRVNSAHSAMLHIGNAEEDFKLLSLPVTLSADDLRVLVKRNEGNTLFAHAVSQYAKNHEYNDEDLRALAAPTTFTDNLNIVDEAGAQLMKYCEENRLDDAIKNDWRAASFAKVDEEGLFDKL